MSTQLEDLQFLSIKRPLAPEDVIRLSTDLAEAFGEIDYTTKDILADLDNIDSQQPTSNTEDIDDGAGSVQGGPVQYVEVLNDEDDLGSNAFRSSRSRPGGGSTSSTRLSNSSSSKAPRALSGMSITTTPNTNNSSSSTLNDNHNPSTTDSPLTSPFSPGYNNPNESLKRKGSEVSFMSGNLLEEDEDGRDGEMGRSGGMHVMDFDRVEYLRRLRK
ncbi:hypothetical protein HK102_009281, partial [Quaeritorhiza haematococci]